MKYLAIRHYVVSCIYMIFENIKKFIFPSRCVLCDKLLPYGDKLENVYLCDDCKDKLEFIKEPTCKKCGAMIDNADELYCIRCKNDLLKNYEYGFGLLRYNDYVKESLHRIKYNGRKEYIDFYGKCIARKYVNKFIEIEPDYLVPVPIHKSRLVKRNYNQSEELANSISDELKRLGVQIRVNNDIIFRTKNTKVLNKLDNIDRREELRDAFYTEDLSNIEKVVIIDDIYTTGTTIDLMSKSLKNAGIKEVYFAVIAIVDNL